MISMTPTGRLSYIGPHALPPRKQRHPSQPRVPHCLSQEKNRKAFVCPLWSQMIPKCLCAFLKVTYILIMSIFKINFFIPDKKQKKNQNFEACSSGETCLTWRFGGATGSRKACCHDCAYKSSSRGSDTRLTQPRPSHMSGQAGMPPGSAGRGGLSLIDDRLW